MDYDIFLAPAADSWKVVKRAEELGFHRAWMYDTQLLNSDVFVSLAAAAMQTSRIRLGTGVLIPSNRIAPVNCSRHSSTSRSMRLIWLISPSRIPTPLLCRVPRTAGDYRTRQRVGSWQSAGDPKRRARLRERV